MARRRTGRRNASARRLPSAPFSIRSNRDGEETGDLRYAQGRGVEKTHPRNGRQRGGPFARRYSAYGQAAHPGTGRRRSGCRRLYQGGDKKPEQALKRVLLRFCIRDKAWLFRRDRRPHGVDLIADFPEAGELLAAKIDSCRDL